ncbi:MAG TPA: hypothetical protein DDW52_05260 [Planctomycetaceae bacterium]|nr:hypothetical protein [Planctomycetaceae bacterium]
MNHRLFVATDKDQQAIGKGRLVGNDIEVTFNEEICLSEVRLSTMVAVDLFMAESLTCGECGNDGPDTLAEAIADGWKSLAYDPEGVSWNFVGLCDCCVSNS